MILKSSVQVGSWSVFLRVPATFAIILRLARPRLKLRTICFDLCSRTSEGLVSPFFLFFFK